MSDKTIVTGIMCRVCGFCLLPMTMSEHLDINNPKNKCAICDAYNLLIKDSEVEERLENCIENKDFWIEAVKDEENSEETKCACRINAIIASEKIKMCRIEKLIYKAISNTTTELLAKYKEKYMEHMRKALELFEVLTDAKANTEGEYLEQANNLKQDYDYLEWAISNLN